MAHDSHGSADESWLCINGETLFLEDVPEVCLELLLP